MRQDLPAVSHITVPLPLYAQLTIGVFRIELSLAGVLARFDAGGLPSWSDRRRAIRPVVRH
jgi:hypothetical protein